MKKTRHTPEQIVRKLRQAEARLASRSFGAFGGVGHARQAAEYLWALSGAAQRAPLRTGEALPGRQEGRLNPHEDSGRGSFVRGFISSPILLCLRRNSLLKYAFAPLREGRRPVT
jgi:hypothetical protein